jgi:hypothetical protein
VTSLTPDSDPGFKFWNSSKTSATITGIERVGDNIKFSVSGFNGEEPPKPAKLKVEAFANAAIITFESDREYDGPANVTLTRDKEIISEAEVMPYEPGKYSIRFTGLTPGNKTYKVNVNFTLEGIVGAGRGITFMTTKAAPVKWPYIYINKNKANEDGTYAAGTKIALMTYNTEEAAEICWTFNGNNITPAGDGYYTITEGGILKAEVLWEDGSKDIIEKKINISNSK